MLKRNGGKYAGAGHAMHLLHPNHKTWGIGHVSVPSAQYGSMDYTVAVNLAGNPTIRTDNSASGSRKQCVALPKNSLDATATNNTDPTCGTNAQPPAGGNNGGTTDNGKPSTGDTGTSKPSTGDNNTGKPNTGNQGGATTGGSGMSIIKIIGIILSVLSVINTFWPMIQQFLPH